MPRVDEHDNDMGSGGRLSRRAVIGGLAMLPLATVGLAGSAYAAVPPQTDAQAPGFYRYRVGATS